MKKKAIFPGSFNPFTIGHAEIVRLGLIVFDKIYIVFAKNPKKDGNISTVAINMSRVESYYKKLGLSGRVEVIASDKLTATVAKELDATIIRGLRGNVADFDYEKSLCHINRMLGAETFFIITDPKFDCISSSMVRELRSHGEDVSKYVV